MDPIKQYPITRRTIYLFFAILNLFIAVFRLFLFPEQGFLFHAGLYVVSTMALFMAWEFIMWMGKRLESYFSKFTRPYLQIIVQVVIMYVIAFCLGETIFGYAGRIFHITVPALLQLVAKLLYLMMSLLMNLLYFGSTYFNQWKENLVRSERLQREQSQMQYDALRNQLNPHFLFNALTSLNSLIFENQQLASDFLQQLSRVYRYLLQHKDKDVVLLKTEVEFIRNYINLLQTRFNKALFINMNLADSSLDKGIVPVTLQVLIENAVKHNVINVKNVLHIEVSADDAFLIVKNNLQPKTTIEGSNKQGLQNLRALYSFLSPLPVEISEANNIFEIKIPLITS